MSTPSSPQDSATEIIGTQIPRFSAHRIVPAIRASGVHKIEMLKSRDGLSIRFWRRETIGGLSSESEYMLQGLERGWPRGEVVLWAAFYHWSLRNGADKARSIAYQREIRARYVQTLSSAGDNQHAIMRLNEIDTLIAKLSAP